MRFRRGRRCELEIHNFQFNAVQVDLIYLRQINEVFPATVTEAAAAADDGTRRSTCIRMPQRRETAYYFIVADVNLNESVCVSAYFVRSTLNYCGQRPRYAIVIPLQTVDVESTNWLHRPPGGNSVRHLHRVSAGLCHSMNIEYCTDAISVDNNFNSMNGHNNNWTDGDDDDDDDIV